MDSISDRTSLDLSISILTWNTREFLKSCLDSIYRHTRRITFEIIVVDNGSHDGAVEMVRQHYPEIILIRNETNLGFTAGNNQALSRCRGRYVFLLNSDTEIREGTLDLLVEAMDRDTDVGIGIPKMFYPDGKLYLSIHPRFPDPLSCLSERSFLTELFPDGACVARFRKRYFFTAETDYHQDRDVAWGLGAALMARRTAVDHVGLLDEGFFAFFEEIDWCLRFRNAGWKVRYYHEPVVLHHTAGSLRQDYDRVTTIWHHSRFYFYQKHYSWWDRLLLRLIVIPGIAIRLIKLLFSLGNPAELERKKILQTIRTYGRIFISAIVPFNALTTRRTSERVMEGKSGRDSAS